MIRSGLSSATLCIMLLFVLLTITLTLTAATTASSSRSRSSRSSSPARLQKRRELRQKSASASDAVTSGAVTSASSDDAPSLDMNCDDMSSSDCVNYMQNYLFDHINVQRKYSRLNIPVKNPYNKLDPPEEGDVYDTVHAELLMTFHDLIAVDTVAGSITLSFFLDLYWVDHLLTWNASNTLGNAELVVPMEMIWNPDFVIYNAVGGSSMEQVVVFLYADGSVNFSGKGVVDVACTFDLLHFPFDTQTCSAGM